MRRNQGYSKRSIIILSIMALILTGTAVFLFLNTRTDEIAAAYSENISVPLLFSVHEEGEHLFTQLFIFHPSTGKGAFFDIPGEVGLMVSSARRIDRIDSVFSVQQPDEFLDLVGRMVGLEISFHMIVEISALIQLVDLLGGVELFIANPVEYMEDEDIILLPSGSISLDGAKAVLYGTYHDSEESEVERVNRRQRMTQAFFSRIGEESALFADATVTSMFKKRIATNLGNRALLSYIEALRLFDADRAVFQRVLGTRRDVDGQILLFPHYEGRLVREAMDQTLLSIASETVYSDEDIDISIEILNGTSRNGLAGRTSTIYKSFGYEIVGVGNAPEGSVDKTYIIAHSGEPARAQRVANVIQCKEIRSAAEANFPSLHESGRVIDVTIVLGKDFDGRYCKSE